ncbi:TrmB family transcriptional regulator [Candidatus Pacearchaeota archaeon]|nr:TrmB family transcriptional regulator [Candidatus Pacearchaeota archaeon]
MLVKQELINKIKDYFDLNIYETKVWLALIGKGIASAGEIAQISGVPRSRTYDVLESLEKRGFAIIKLGKPVKYLGVKPNVIIEKMKNNVHHDAEERIESLTRVKETTEYEQLESLYKQGIAPVNREDVHASIKGRSNIVNHAREIIENATSEVVICTNAEDIFNKVKLFNQTISKLIKNGIKVKIALSGSEEHVKKINTQLGIKAKHIEIDSKFFIIDRKEVLFYLKKQTESSQDENAIWLNSEFFAGALASMFELATGGKQ